METTFWSMDNFICINLTFDVCNSLASVSASMVPLDRNWQLGATGPVPAPKGIATSEACLSESCSDL